MIVWTGEESCSVEPAACCRWFDRAARQPFPEPISLEVRVRESAQLTILLLQGAATANTMMGDAPLGHWGFSAARHRGLRRGPSKHSRVRGDV